MRRTYMYNEGRTEGRREEKRREEEREVVVVVVKDVKRGKKMKNLDLDKNIE